MADEQREESDDDVTDDPRRRNLERLSWTLRRIWRLTASSLLRTAGPTAGMRWWLRREDRR